MGAVAMAVEEKNQRQDGFDGKRLERSAKGANALRQGAKLPVVGPGR